MQYSISRTHDDNIDSGDLPLSVFRFYSLVSPDRFSILPFKMPDSIVFSAETTLTYKLVVNGSPEATGQLRVYEAVDNTLTEFALVAVLKANTAVIPLTFSTDNPVVAILPELRVKSFTLDFSVSARSGSVIGAQPDSIKLEWVIADPPLSSYSLPNFELLDSQNSQVTLNGLEQNDEEDYVFTNGGLNWIGNNPALTPGDLLVARLAYD